MTDEEGRLAIEEALSLPWTRTQKGHALLYRPPHRCPYEWSNGQIRRSHYVVWLSGKEIPAGHAVHHINEDRLDDRLENLEIKTGADHTREHWRGDTSARRQRISMALQGRVVSEETRQKISLAGMGKRNAAGKRGTEALANIRQAVRAREEKRTEKDSSLRAEAMKLSADGKSSRKIATILSVSKDRVLRLLRSLT